MTAPIYISLADTISVRKQALLLEEVQKLNRENAERSGILATLVEVTLPASAVDFILEVPKPPVAEQEKVSEEEKETKDVPQEVKEAKEEEKKMEEVIPEVAKEEAEKEITGAPESEVKVEEELIVEKEQEEATLDESVPEPEEPEREPSPQTDSGDAPAEPVTLQR